MFGRGTSGFFSGRPARLRLPSGGVLTIAHVLPGIANTVITAHFLFLFRAHLAIRLEGGRIFNFALRIGQTNSIILNSDLNVISGNNVGFAEEPAGFDTDKRGLASMVRPHALKRTDLIIGKINDIVSEVPIQVAIEARPRGLGGMARIIPGQFGLARGSFIIAAQGGFQFIERLSGVAVLRITFIAGAVGRLIIVVRVLRS